MRLLELLGDVDVLELRGSPRTEVTAVAHDHRRVRPGTCFLAVPGARFDGHELVGAAVERGAVAVVAERDVAVDEPVALALVPRVRAAMGPIAATFHGHPSGAMRCLGITGTNGKTTTTHLLEAIARVAGESPGVLGTLGGRGGGLTWPGEHTTPEAPELQERLAALRDAGITTVAMEVSSHALDQGRVDGTTFAAVCLTNITHEHLDYHGDVDTYVDAKARLFTPAFARMAAIGVDGPHGVDVAARAEALGLDVRRFSVRDGGAADVHATRVEIGSNATRIVLVDARTGARVDVASPLVGAFNVENLVAAAATALAAGYELDVIGAGLSAEVSVPGRLEAIRVGQPFAVMVDYAHSPDALERVVAVARELAGGGRVLLVFGCGGDRDRTKRPLMGAAAAGADLVVLTSDNARSEDPAAIAAEAEVGLRDAGAHYEVELDRRGAIVHVLAAARAGDVVVIAGKGHETGQTAAGVTTPFDDRVEARAALRGLGWR